MHRGGMGVAPVKRFLIFLLCAGLLIGGVFFFLFSPRANSVYNKTLMTLTEKIEEALEEHWLIQVDIEGLRFSFFRPELVGVKVYTLDGQPLLTAERVRIRCNWFALLFGQKKPVRPCVVWNWTGLFCGWTLRNGAASIFPKSGRKKNP